MLNVLSFFAWFDHFRRFRLQHTVNRDRPDNGRRAPGDYRGIGHEMCDSNARQLVHCFQLAPSECNSVLSVLYASYLRPVTPTRAVMHRFSVPNVTSSLNYIL